MWGVEAKEIRETRSVLFCSAGNQPQGLAQARPELYHEATSPAQETWLEIYRARSWPEDNFSNH